jgi:hypothetical protein
MNLLKLPCGLIVNLDHIVYIWPPKEGKTYVVFSAAPQVTLGDENGALLYKAYSELAKKNAGRFEPQDEAEWGTLTVSRH